MPKHLLAALLALGFPFIFLAQTGAFEASWFQRRIDWVDRYEALIPLNHRLAIAERKGRLGIVSLSGDEKMPFIYFQRIIGAQGLTLSDGNSYVRYDTAGNVWLVGPRWPMDHRFG
ncbi:MAG: hypothetical protein IT260_23610 [Saprospiraceae bacterium]|nr:hypothetical protein [Saprospiraceae bacterium]